MNLHFVESLVNLKKKLNIFIFDLIIARTSEIQNIGKMPGSCADLRQIGYIKSGFYMIMGKSFVQSVYCVFDPLSQNGSTLYLLTLIFSLCAR